MTQLPGSVKNLKTELNSPAQAAHAGIAGYARLFSYHNKYIAPDKALFSIAEKYLCFPYFSIKAYVVGTH